jgi:hypothetical protein
MNAVWSDERNQFSVQTVKAILITKSHFRYFLFGLPVFLRKDQPFYKKFSHKKYDIQETINAPNPGSC